MHETTIAVRWPTIAATSAGRWVGRLAAWPLGVGRVFTLGTLAATLTIPVSLAIFCWQLMPYVCRRYRLTDRRIIVEKGLSAVEGESIGLDAFDAIDVDVLPGQAWLRAGDLVFRRGSAEVFRLAGVPHPAPFRHACLAAQQSLTLIGRVLAEQAQPAAAKA
ncbi:MAG: PH domain-containing protein [Pirellulales bacterium]|nr:PH domain-containing protein [Pirellulales bacterium]